MLQSGIIKSSIFDFLTIPDWKTIYFHIFRYISQYLLLSLIISLILIFSLVFSIPKIIHINVKIIWNFENILFLINIVCLENIFVDVFLQRININDLKNNFFLLFFRKRSVWQRWDHVFRLFNIRWIYRRYSPICFLPPLRDQYDEWKEIIDNNIATGKSWTNV